MLPRREKARQPEGREPPRIPWATLAARESGPTSWCKGGVECLYYKGDLLTINRKGRSLLLTI